MFSEKINFFPENPLRQIKQEAKPAPLNINSNAAEKDGQLYFWDNVTEFPDNWRIPNKQMLFLPINERPYLLDRQERINKNKNEQLTLDSLKSKMAWPKEDSKDGRGYSYPYEKKEPKPLHWPEEDSMIGEGFYYPHLGKIPSDYIKRNQKFWKNRKRGVLSRVLELNHSGNLLHKK